MTSTYVGVWLNEGGAVEYKIRTALGFDPPFEVVSVLAVGRGLTLYLDRAAIKALMDALESAKDALGPEPAKESADV